MPSHIYVKDSDGTWIPAQGDTNGALSGVNKDPSSNHRAHVSHFGVLKAGPTVPVFKGNFPGSSLDLVQWEEVALNSASITVADGMAQMACGTNTAGSVTLRSRLNGRFEAGQVTVFQSGVRVGTGLANNVRIWGLMDQSQQEGLYFKWNGTTFQVVARKGGTETAVNQASFNGETDWSPVDQNTTYRIEYSAGRAIFYRASGGLKVLLHQMVDTAAPLVNDLDLGVYYENTNSGNTTDVSMYIRGSSSSVWGSLDSYNTGGALVTTQFDQEVALNRVSDYSLRTKFGRNPDIDTTSDPEDLWNGGSVYTGHNATAGENIEVFSASAADDGTLVSSGTATGGSRTTLIDTGATFVTDGVAVGDCLINDAQNMHGIIRTVDSETQVTVWRMQANHPTARRGNVAGDSYRIATTASTGLAVLRISGLLNASYEQQPDEYVIMNGTSGVTVTGSYMRCDRAFGVLAGSGGVNAGQITVRQATTTANVFAVMPTFGQTTIGATTIPAGKIAIIRRVRAAITRNNGSAGSATIILQIRQIGESWRAIRDFEIQTGASVEFTQLGGDVLLPGTDIKFTIQQVSDNGTIADGAFEYTLIDE